MSFRIHSLGVYLFSVILLTLFSCEKEEATEQNLQKVALIIETLNGESGVADLVITNPNGSTTQNKIDFNTVQDIEIDLETNGTYKFEVDDLDFGKIKMFATGEALQGNTSQNPFIIQFEHYRKQQVATFQVNSFSESSSRIRFIDLTLTQTYQSSLYHIDWGDGTSEVAESPDEIIQTPSDRIEHRYAASGDYTITISTTNLEEVTGVDLQITGNGQGDHIQTLNLASLPNLKLLQLGDSELLTIDSTIANYPNLENLIIRFGNLTSIDVSKNPLLESLIVSENFDTQIKGLSTLTKLEFLGLTGIVEDLDLSVFSELYHLSIIGHKMPTLDVSQNTKLTSLSLHLNDLEEINLASNVNLETLFITNNRLTELDLSNNTEIKYLNLYANYIDELNIGQQSKLEYLNLSSVHLKQVIAPESLDYITTIDISDARFLDEKELLNAVFEGQENNLKKEGRIIFHDLAVILEEQIEALQELIDDHNWDINIPE